ncbi:histidine phosphatase family protein [Acinetobacter gerneri]|uniref:histidine phosphatase family protein n=1 Tax=Acinetobacter gerneri TaxID=202952 RepID=UPI0028AE8896|nr:histidine phosphatase family protein [Acinetobacter gerneri]
MQLQIDLLRHGETQLGHTLRGSTDDALTELGKKQMHIGLEQSIQNPVQWNVIFTSPLQRCNVFAQQIADQYHLPIYQNVNLKEMHFGEWEGIPVAEIYQHSPELLANFWQFPTRFTPPKGESLFDFRDRILSALKEIQFVAAKYNANQVLIVTHGGVIKLLKCLAMQKPLDDILKMGAELAQLNTLYLTENLELRLTEETVK